MARLTGELIGPTAQRVYSGGVSYRSEKGTAKNLLRELKREGLESLATQNPDKQPWQRYSLSGIVVTFTPAEAEDRHGVKICCSH